MAKHAGSSFTPEWENESPPEKSYRSIFKWGAPDFFKHPKPQLYEMLKERLNLTDEDFRERKREGRAPVRAEEPSRLNGDQLDVLAGIVGTENLSLDEYDRVRFAHGQTVEEAMKLRDGRITAVCDAAVHPRDKNDVREIVAYCNEQSIPVYVFGGGSSVNMGFTPVKGGVTLVMQTHMNRLLELNEENRSATVQAGIMGPDYEDLLNRAPGRLGAKRSYTCGHFPQSFEYSTVGGWIAALGSGQQSSYYGDACDLVLAQEYVTPAGEFKTFDFPAAATGPKVNDMMKGGEGSYGVLVAATLKVFRHMPQNARRFAYIFPSWESAVDACREVSQGEFGMPSVFRVSDPEETDVALKLYGVEGTLLEKYIRRRGFKPMERCLLIGRADGERGFARHVKKMAGKVCSKQGAMYITGYPVKKWEHGRYTDPYLRDSLGDFGIVTDTLETTVNWDNLHRVHRTVRSYIKSRSNAICMTHSSHFYPQGTNLYFIFITRMDNVEEYRDFQSGIIDKIYESGGSLSHHHGVGRMIGPWMKKYLDPVEMGTLKALKKYFDPKGIMNPGGALGLD